MRLIDSFDRTVRCYPDKTAFVTEDGRSFAYATLDERATRFANALRERIGSGRCAVLARNGAAAVESMIAGDKRGVATVQLSFRITGAELARMAETASARALVFDDANAETALQVLEMGDFDAAIHAGSRDLDQEEVESYEAVLSNADAGMPAALPEDEECAVLYTSGTTSTPKAVAFDQRQLWYGGIQGVAEHGIDETDVALCTTPWYHMLTTAAWIYPHFVAGATVVLQREFDPEASLALIEEHDATGLLAVPTQLRALNGIQRGAGYDVDSLSYIRTAGAVVTGDLVEETGELLCEEFYNTYGMTEAGPNLSFAHPEAQADHPGTIGKEALSWELRVVETAPLEEHPDPGATVDPGNRGEIIARGPGMAEGYIDNETAGERTFFDGWLRTRDVAEIDEDGYLYIVDRVDNMLVTGGENVYPAAVERALEDHPDVQEAGVLGLDDEEWGEVVAAVVVTEASLSPVDLDAFCREHDSLADFKRPREYAITDEPLPRTDTGTIVREELRSEHFSDR